MNQPEPAVSPPPPLPGGTLFQVQSISPIDSPLGGSDKWYCYVISQGPNGENAITGQRSGSLDEVNEQLKQMVQRLNERLGKLKAKK